MSSAGFTGVGFSTSEIPGKYTYSFPAGSQIEFGENQSPDGPTLCLSMTAAGAQSPSLVFAIDPISFQPLLSVRVGSGGMQTVPLDKLIGSLRNAGTGSLLTGR